MIVENIKSILGSLDIDDAKYFADINLGSPELAIALFNRYACEIDILSLDANGQYTKPSKKALNIYLSELEKGGVSKSAVRVVDHPDMQRRYDIISSINSFGSALKIKPLAEVMSNTLHDQSRMVFTVKKGSGSYPFLGRFGGCNTLVPATADQLGLVVFSVEPQSKKPQDWSIIARKLATDGGFFTDCGEHSFLYVPRGKTLVVTFDNLDIAMTKREDRRPWGYSFVEAQNWSILGVMANGWTWFRDDKVIAEFDRLKNEGFFKQFERVVFYGASMGGYAAAAYSSAAEGSTVFTISPQSTLDKSVVPWEARYKKVWDRDFSGDYGDAALVSQHAEAVHIMYDPYVKPDAAHAQRFTGANVRHWRCPHLGHRLGSSLAQMGILQEISKKCITGELDDTLFYQLLRHRRDFPRYLRELTHLSLERNHIDLAKRVSSFAKLKKFGRLHNQLEQQINAAVS